MADIEGFPAQFSQAWKNRSALLERAPAALRPAILALRGFRADQAPLRAAGLTYTTLLSIVPILAFAFAMLRGLGFHEDLLGFLIQNFAPTTSFEAQEAIISFVSRVNAKTIGAIGLGTFLVTVVITLGTVERSFNAIFGVRHQRPLIRKFTDYFSMILLAPLLLGITMSGTVISRIRDWLAPLGVHWVFFDAGALSLQLVPLAGAIVLFTLALIILPNTHVRLRPAVIGGVTGGVMWFILQWAYVVFQFGFSRQQAIYGALAQLPVLMVWLYLTWCVVLYAAELAATLQGRRMPRPSEGEEPAGADRFALALRAMTALARRSATPEPAWTLDALAEALDAPEYILETTMQRLEEYGLIAETKRDSRLILTRHTASIPAVEIFDAMEEPAEEGGAPEGSGPAALMREMQRGRRNALEGISLERLAGEAGSFAEAPPALQPAPRRAGA